MYIQPNTTIHILHGIPLSRNYENTVWYSDASAQSDAFLTYNKYTLSQYSYQRAQLGSIRVQIAYENLYDCNYLMFQNTAFGNKWFYAFIDGVSYINNNVSEIYYTIDVLQTWCYDYYFMDSFVDRRHADVDAWYLNTKPEGLELGEHYHRYNVKEIKFTDSMHYIIIASDIDGITPTDNVTQYGHMLINNIYNGLYVHMSSDVDAITTVIQKYVDAGKEDAIVAFYMSPCDTPMDVVDQEYAFTGGGNTTLGDYTPTNKKLLSAPFHRIAISNNSGGIEYLAPQRFTSKVAMKYTTQAVAFPNAQARLVPTNYDATGHDIDYAMVYGNFPTCSFSGDAFKLWWAQNKNSYLASLNAIDATYDTNRAIAQNDYAMAQRSAQAGSEIGQLNIDTGLANSQASQITQAANMTRDLNTSTVVNNVSGLAGLLQGRLPTTANLQARESYINGMNTLATSGANAQRSAGAASAINQIQLSLAMKNAATSYANSNLSMLTSKNNAINSLMAKKQDIANVPNTAKLNASVDGMNWAMQTASIIIAEECIDPEYAEAIDKYFTAYGYAQDQMMSGTRLNARINRQHFTYLRTVGANIKGNLNQQDLSAIKAIYDNGVTTWDTLEDVGNYELENGTLVS